MKSGLEIESSPKDRDALSPVPTLDLTIGAKRGRIRVARLATELELWGREGASAQLQRRRKKVTCLLGDLLRNGDALGALNRGSPSGCIEAELGVGSITETGV